MESSVSSSLRHARAAFAAEVMAAAGVHDDALAQALREVPRERSLGPGPWTSLTLALSSASPPPPVAQDPSRVLHNVAVRSADGSVAEPTPALLALLLHEAGLRRGDDVMLVGRRLDYAQALAGWLTGRAVQSSADGAVPARDADADAARPAPTLDALIVWEGCSGPPWAWLEMLRPGGRAIFPLLGMEGSALYWHVTCPRTGPRWPARVVTLGETVPCAALWDPCEAALADALSHRLLEARSLVLTLQDGEDMVLVCGQGGFSLVEPAL